MGEEYNRLNLLELLLASMKGGAKYPYELNYLAGSLANIIDPTKKRVIAFDQDQLGTAMVADLKDLYSNINAGRSWRGINPVIAITNTESGNKLLQLVKETMVEELTKSYPLVGSTLGSMEYPFGGRDEIIILGNYNLEDLMKVLRNSLYPQLKINYDIPNGFISRALYDISEDAVRDIGRYNESYGKNYYVARSAAIQDKVTTYFYYSPEVIPEEVIKREFTFQCISTDPQFGNAPFYVKSQMVQGSGSPKIINTNTNKIIGFSDMDTRVMQKLFSGKDVTFNKMFSDAVENAYKNGKSSMYIDGDQLLFSEMDGSVMVEDPAMGQMTQAAPNPNVPGDMQLQAIQQGNAGMPMNPNAMAQQPMIDPNTGMQMVPMTDPMTGQPVLDQMGQPMMQLIDPNTGQPAIDPTTGQPMIAQPQMMQQMAQAQPQPMIQGQPAGVPQVDPVTGQPINIAPADPSAMQQNAQPYEFAAAGQQQFSKNTELMNKLFVEDDVKFNKVFSDAVDTAFAKGRAKMFSGGTDGRTLNLGRVINPRTGIPEVIVQDYSNKGLQLTRVFADTKNNKMRLNSIEVNNNKDMVRRFSDETEVMTRIFSQVDPQFNSDFSRAVLRAYNDGKSYMFSEKSGKEIELTRIYGDVVAEDKETGELTAVTPDDGGDLNLVALDNYGQDDSNDGYYNDGDVPYDDIVDNLEDRDPVEPEFYNEIDAGIVDEIKAGLEGNPEDSFEGGEDYDCEGMCEDSRDFSIDYNLFGKDGLKMFSEEFVTAEKDLKGNKNFNPEFTTDVNVGISAAGGDGRDSRDGKVEAGSDTEPWEIGGAGKVGDGGCEESRNYSIDEELGIHMYSDDDVLTDIAEKANDIQSGVDELTETKDKELAEDLQDKVDDLKKELEIFEGDDEIDTEDVKEQCKKYSKVFSNVLNGHYDSLEYKTVNFSDTADNKVETPAFTPNSNLLSMLFSGTENEDLIDAAQAEDAGIAPEGEYTDIPSYQEQPEVAPMLEGDNNGGSVSVTIDGDSNDITIDKSFSDTTNQTKTFAQNAYVSGEESNSLFSNCLTCELN